MVHFYIKLLLCSLMREMHFYLINHFITSQEIWLLVVSWQPFLLKLLINHCLNTWEKINVLTFEYTIICLFILCDCSAFAQKPWNADRRKCGELSYALQRHCERQTSRSERTPARTQKNKGSAFLESEELVVGTSGPSVHQRARASQVPQETRAQARQQGMMQAGPFFVRQLP